MVSMMVVWVFVSPLVIKTWIFRLFESRPRQMRSRTSYCVHTTQSTVCVGGEHILVLLASMHVLRPKTCMFSDPRITLIIVVASRRAYT